MGSNHEKNRGRKSRDTLPIIIMMKKQNGKKKRSKKKTIYVPGSSTALVITENGERPYENYFNNNILNKLYKL